jgi:hypothetical protein
MQRSAVVALIFLIALWATAYGQSGQSDIEALSQKAANPIANLISLPLQNNTDFGLGAYDRASNVLNIQPVVPFANGRLITRTIFPIVWVPDLASESGNLSTGLGDILFTAFYVPSSGQTMWGLGPVIQFPSGGEMRGTQKWSAGISGVLLAQPGNWTLGVLANNLWSFAGDEDAADVNQGSLQYFIVYQLGGGWYVNSAPIITVNWEADSGQKWKVPFGAGGGKLLSVGKLPVNLQSQAYYYAASPDAGPDWQLRVQVQFFLPMPGSDGD